MSTRLSHIRNFAIVAHIDHGKSTLSDRLIQETGGLTAREMKEQVLDNMDIERERGITIKAQTVRLDLQSRRRRGPISPESDRHPRPRRLRYEVSPLARGLRRRAAGHVDAGQGVEAQTLANVYLAMENRVSRSSRSSTRSICLQCRCRDRVKPADRGCRSAIDASPTRSWPAPKNGIGIDDDPRGRSSPSAARSQSGFRTVCRCAPSSSTPGSTPIAASSCWSGCSTGR